MKLISKIFHPNFFSAVAKALQNRAKETFLDGVNCVSAMVTRKIAMKKLDTAW